MKTLFPMQLRTGRNDEQLVIPHKKEALILEGTPVRPFCIYLFVPEYMTRHEEVKDLVRRRWQRNVEREMAMRTILFVHIKDYLPSACCRTKTVSATPNVALAATWRRKCWQSDHTTARSPICGLRE